MPVITTRKIQRDYPLGGLVTTLPIGWVNYVETKYNDTLKVVEMYEKDDCLVIQPAFSREAQYHDEDREGPFMGKREYRPYKYRPLRRIGSQVRDFEGHFTKGFLRKVYRSGMKSRIVSLPKDWVVKHQKRVKKDLHYVDITIRDELWLKPHFLNLPRMIRGVPVTMSEYIPQIAGEPSQPIAGQPQVPSTERPAEASSQPSATSDGLDGVRDRVLERYYKYRRRKGSYLPLRK